VASHLCSVKTSDANHWNRQSPTRKRVEHAMSPNDQMTTIQAGGTSVAAHDGNAGGAPKVDILGFIKVMKKRIATDNTPMQWRRAPGERWALSSLTHLRR
jgi:hypothetical protein